jgi:hypothetical protein
VLQIKLKIENKIESGSMTGSLPFPPEIFTQVGNLNFKIKNLILMQVFVQMLTYIRLCLATEAGAKISAHAARPQPIEAAPILGQHLRKLLASEETAGPVKEYFKLLIDLLSMSPG